MSAHYADATVTLHHGSCLDVLAELPDASVDSVVTDPPYGLGFMGKEWDKIKQEASRPPSADVTDARFNNKFPRTGKGPAATAFDGIGFQAWCLEWASECYRVLKPGGHMLAFGGTRTWHRLTCAAEDAGFDIRDSVAWLYGSGFPKSLDVSKAIDKLNGRTGEVVAFLKAELRRVFEASGLTLGELNARSGFEASGYLRTSSTWASVMPTPEKWAAIRAAVGCDDDFSDEFRAAEREVIQERTMTQGGGTSLQLRMGEAREVRADITAPATDDARTWQGWGTALKPAFEPVVVARKPLAGTVAANVLAHGTGALNIAGCRIGSDVIVSSGQAVGDLDKRRHEHGTRPSDYGRRQAEPSAHVGRWPANVVLDESQARELDQMSGEQRDGVAVNRNRSDDEMASWYGTHKSQTGSDVTYGGQGGASRFFYVAKADASERVRVDGIAHPTVKPLALMRWLVRLVTPPGGTVLEPFAGSGTTVEACILEGFRCVAIEREADYLPLITQRIHRRRDPVEAVKALAEDRGLFDLLNEETA